MATKENSPKASSPKASSTKASKTTQASPVKTTKPRNELMRIGYTHDAMIDALIAKPTITNQELQEMFGYSTAWISRIRWSDAFQERLKDRKAELVNPELILSIEERIKAIVGKSLEVLEEKLQGDALDVPDNLVLKALELGSKGLGLGGYSNAPQVQVQLPQADHLSRLAENLLLLQKKHKEADTQMVVDVTPKEPAQSTNQTEGKP